MDSHAGRPEIKQAFLGERGRSIRYSNTLRQEMIYVALPITDREEHIAVVRASLPITFIENELNSIRIKIIIGGIIIAILAAGVSLAISRRISRPLETMKKGADRFADGDLSHRMATPDSTEMASLAEAMNQMAAHLQNRIKAASDQRNELETVLSSMLEGVVAVDSQERIISVNQAAARLFETDLETFQYRSIQETIRNLPLQQFIKKALSMTQPLQEDVILFQNQQRILEVKSSPLLNADKIHIGTLIVLNDVTHLRRLENMRSDFVANVSHEIKTPLTAIKGFVETLQHGKVEKPEETRRFLEIIQWHVDRLNAIVEDLLTLSKIEQEDETGTLNLRNWKITDVFQAAIQICRSKAEEKNLPRLFERFYRVDKSRSRQLGGTGLGLAIVKHIAQAHGGYVTVESNVGEGSTFTIHLPTNN